MNKQEETKRVLTEREYDNWFNYLMVWSFFILSGILNIIFQHFEFFDSTISGFSFFWFCISLLVWLALASLFSFSYELYLWPLFNKKWIFVDYSSSQEYTEKQIKNFLRKRSIFLKISIVIFVILFNFNIFFVNLYKEIKDIENNCWTTMYQSYKINRLPEDEKKLVVKYCTLKKDKQWIDSIIKQIWINNKYCSFDKEKLAYVNNLYQNKTEENIKEIKEILTQEINNCKEKIIAEKVENMDSNFNGEFGLEYANLIDFQKRIDEL